jgi:hypothetical protein
MSEWRSAIRAAVERHGAQRTARAMGMATNTVLNLAAGGHCRDGTIALAEQRVARLAELLRGEQSATP